jgi:hypothetical protein
MGARTASVPLMAPRVACAPGGMVPVPTPSVIVAGLVEALRGGT